MKKANGSHFECQAFDFRRGWTGWMTANGALLLAAALIAIGSARPSAAQEKLMPLSDILAPTGLKPAPDIRPPLRPPESSRQEAETPEAATSFGLEHPESGLLRLSQAGSLKELMEQFEQGREALLLQGEAVRKGLLQRLKTAREEEREKLLGALREQHRAWLEEQRAFREELRHRLKTLQQEFRNEERSKLLEEVQDDIRNVRDRIGRD